MKVTLEAVTAIIRETIEAQPGRTSECSYFFEDGSPDCIVGVVFDTLNKQCPFVFADYFSANRFVESDLNEVALSSASLAPLAAFFEDDAWHLLLSAQQAQDDDGSGEPAAWSDLARVLPQ